MAINLLSGDLVAKQPIAKFASTLKTIAYIGYFVLIVALLASGAYFFLLRSEINASKAKQDTLKSSIQTLKSTEQSLILVKDRIKKADIIFGQQKSGQAISSFEQMIAVLPADSTMTEGEITPDKTSASFLVRSSSSLVQLMSGIISKGLYKNIQLKSFGYTPSNGYLVGLEMTN